MRPFWVLISVYMTIALLAVLASTPQKASAQLGNLDNCDTFYRLAKAHLHLFDAARDLSNVYEYNPVLSTAYSNLYVACIERIKQGR